ncbi:MAG: hypothetical protein ACTHNA_12505 [Sphingopyxis terrae]|uniref:hypothetical protein n=1 Tax=Sphingopyxis terrae TaxID=33052 RepID=UPI003F8007A5
MKLNLQFPPEVPDRTAENIPLIVAVTIFVILAYVAFQDFRLGRDLSDFVQIAAVGAPQVVITVASWFFLRRRRLRAEVAKQRLGSGPINSAIEV